MTTPPLSTPEALQACVAQDTDERRYFVDFDYTLLLANSTDTYLQSARPKPLFWLILKALGLFRPWLLRGVNSVFLYRDAMRLALIERLRPALLADLEARASEIFAAHENTELTATLKTVPAERIVIVSFGLTKVIAAILATSRFKDSTIVASQSERLIDDRKSGKLKMLERAGFFLNPELDVVVSDSYRDDQDILETVTQSFFIKWG
ncbi:MAG: HAD family hydrolase [Pseudomonadota bacterium]